MNVMKPPREIEFIPFPAECVMIVDDIVKMTPKMYSGTIDSAPAWKLVDKIVTLWQKSYPKESEQFIRDAITRKATLNNDYAAAEEPGMAQLRHHMEIPQKVFVMLKQIFPNQEWDKKFAVKFGKHHPMFWVPKKL